MNFVSFMWNGPSFKNSQYLRSNYPEDTLIANRNSSFNYEGNFIVIKNDDKELIRHIDNAAIFKTVSTKIRNEAQSKFNRMYFASLGTAIVSGTVTIITGVGVIAGTAPVVPASIIAVSSGFFCITSAVRTDQANEEYKNWNDPFIGYLKLRKELKDDFRKLEKLDLRKKLFTADETKHIFIKTIKAADKEFQNKLGQSNSELIEFINDFIDKKCPLSNSSIHYAFREDKTVTNPKSPQKGSWTRIDMEKLANDFHNISGRISGFKLDFQKKINDLENTHEVASAAVSVLGVGANVAIESNEANELEPYINQKETKIAQLKAQRNSGSITTTEYLKRKDNIEEEFKDNPEIKKIKRKTTSNQLQKNVGEYAIDTALHQYKRHQITQMKNQFEVDLVRNFEPSVSQLFQNFREMRKISNL